MIRYTKAAGMVRLSIVGALLFVSPDTVLAQQQRHAYSCGYLRLDLERSVFQPGFVTFLRDRYADTSNLDGRDGISSADMQRAVRVWNDGLMHFRRIVYQPEHLARMLWLEQQLLDYKEGAVGLDTLGYLAAWSVYRLVDPAGRPVTSEVDEPTLNLEKKPAVRSALETLAADPAGHVLVTRAAESGLEVEMRPLRGVAAQYYPAQRRIVIDPTVAAAPFKLNFLVHEFVHMANPYSGNSLIEEALAEIIGMHIQDRVTGVTMSCHPYVVFVDTLLDPEYAHLPLNNGIEEHLVAAGVPMWSLPETRRGGD